MALDDRAIRRRVSFFRHEFCRDRTTYISVLLIGVFVSDRIAIAQWGLTRTIVGLLRGLCYQMTLSLAAELGHDHAIGARESLQQLYARGSIVLTLFASVTTSGALVFWPDFFEIWTHGAIPYDATLATTLLLGMCAGAPAILALSYANYSNRGTLLLWTKSLQLAIFLILSLILIPRLGPLGAAVALISSDIIAQFGVLFVVVLRETLRHPIRHTLFLIMIMVTVVSAGAAIGETIRYLLPGAGPVHFCLNARCGLWQSPCLQARWRTSRFGTRWSKRFRTSSRCWGSRALGAICRRTRRPAILLRAMRRRYRASWQTECNCIWRHRYPQPRRRAALKGRSPPSAPRWRDTSSAIRAEPYCALLNAR